jgi:hypothetical protein
MVNKKCTGRTEEIIKMLRNGFFDVYVSSEEIKTELVRNGKKKFCYNIEETLLRLLNRLLERKQVNINGKNAWVYRKKIDEQDAEEREFIFTKGSRYDFHIEIKKIITKAKKEVMIVDSYIDEDIFDLYMEKLPKNITNIKILTNPNTPKGNFYKVAPKFKSQKPSFEVRESTDCHDRILFVDSDAWVFGQSIKSAGNKPTYLIKIQKSAEFRKIFDTIWNQSKKTC